MTGQQKNNFVSHHRGEQLIGVGIVLAALIFVFDLLVPLGVAGGVPYVALVLLTMWLPGRRWTYLAGITGTVLTIIGYFTSPSTGAIVWMVLTNRCLAFFGIWVSVYFVIKYKKAHAALQQESDFVNTILNTTEGLIVVLNKKGEIVHCNPAFNKITGSELKELKGQPLHRLFESSDSRYELHSKKPIEDFPQMIDAKLRSSDGSIRSVTWRNGIIKNGQRNRAAYIVASGIDITELHDTKNTLKQMNRQLQRYARELKRSNQELEHFAYVVSHDLQEPLRMVVSYSQILKKRYCKELNEEANEFIDFAVDGAQRMQQLINDLLQYSRVGTKGKNFQPVDFNDVLGKVQLNLAQPLQEHNAKIEVDKMPELNANHTQMMQLFQNLVGNAIKFRGDKPPYIYVTAEELDEYWKFSVKDNGIGIPEDQSQRIFQVFQRLHTNQEYEGTGIGLAVCKRIVQHHGGSIWLDSKVGDGTTFYFTINKQNSLK